jgi:hypothetical protein
MNLEVQGIDELKQKYANFRPQLMKALRFGFQRALLQIWESIPPYPPPPPGSKYKRTVSGGLGGSLGISEGGGKAGKPDIYAVKRTGDYIEAEFGSRKDYAPYVIGSRAGEQAGHMSHWWTLPEDVFEIVSPKIEKTFEVVISALGKWLEGKGDGNTPA